MPKSLFDGTKSLGKSPEGTENSDEIIHKAWDEWINADELGRLKIIEKWLNIPHNKQFKWMTATLFNSYLTDLYLEQEKRIHELSSKESSQRIEIENLHQENKKLWGTIHKLEENVAEEIRKNTAQKLGIEKALEYIENNTFEYVNDPRVFWDDLWVGAKELKEILEGKIHVRITQRDLDYRTQKRKVPPVYDQSTGRYIYF